MVRDAFVRKPVDRYEWERWLRRTLMPAPLKYLGLMAATYGNQDGTEVRPGVGRLARVMCVSERTVKRSLSDLREYGFLERTKQGNRHAKHADTYRLTVPSDVLELPILDPDER
ncbi:helix-turn-helix domain-containing protein [Nocardia sp. NBC_00565]|uniref:helix-turn-helix domain-containing protein n=1 Tax=Nocardia sp. NBC_00565 TaxID=2975993 RepID=UPI002E804720|nr:helix-turn-helix domain-containing protein [Nocardia sp. NBC_00565]WUC03672.1 helix-turn-helix domain-containing protein [Nocardia sp. NBC_00565]